MKVHENLIKRFFSIALVFVLVLTLDTLPVKATAEKRTLPLDFSDLSSLTETDGTTPVTATNGVYEVPWEGWSFDSTKNELTLDDFYYWDEYTATDGPIICLPDKSTLIIEGDDNWIYSPEMCIYGNDLTIGGPGKIKLKAYEDVCVSGGNSTLTINSGYINMVSGSTNANTDIAMKAENGITINGGDVFAGAEGKYGIQSSKSIIINGGTVFAGGQKNGIICTMGEIEIRQQNADNPTDVTVYGGESALNKKPVLKNIIETDGTWESAATSVKYTHDHTASTDWSKDEGNHWHDCSDNDGGKIDLDAHTYDEWVVDTAATEAAAGNKHRDCTICGYRETAAIPVLTHTHTASADWSKDAASHWHNCTANDGEKMDTAAHTYGEWVIDTAATETTNGSKHRDCTVCGYRETSEIAAAPVSVTEFTVGNYHYAVTSSGESNSAATVKVTGFAKGKSASKVTIDKTVTYMNKVYNITAIADKAFYRNTKIKKVSIGGNVISIGKKAFYGCTKLTDAVIGNKVTALSDNLFYKCTNLTKVTVGTGLKTIGKHVFCRDKKLTSITIKSSKLTKIGQHNLYQCQKLKIKVPSSKVKAYTKLFKSQGQKSSVKITK